MKMGIERVLNENFLNMGGVCDDTGSSRYLFIRRSLGVGGMQAANIGQVSTKLCPTFCSLCYLLYLEIVFDAVV